MLPGYAFRISPSEHFSSDPQYSLAQFPEAVSLFEHGGPYSTLRALKRSQARRTPSLPVLLQFNPHLIAALRQ
jgi:hypothetical protein